MTGIAFYFKVSYMGETEYDVYNDGPTYRVSIRDEASDYMRSITSSKGEAFDREYVNQIGILRDTRGPEKCHLGLWGMVKPELLEAFNQWKLDRHNEWMVECAAKPGKWGQPDTTPPTPAVCGYYQSGLGWFQGIPGNVPLTIERQTVYSKAISEGWSKFGSWPDLYAFADNKWLEHQQKRMVA